MTDLLNPAQRKASKELSHILQTKGLALLWGQIRSGKTRALLETSKPYRTLFITKKDSMGGILSEAKEIGVEVDVINYHSVHTKNPDDYQLVIMDECHLYISQATPKTSAIWKKVVLFTRKKFCIFASGTPTPETYAGLYHMLALSTWTPFPFKRFTLFFKEFGIPDTVYNGERLVPVYKKTQDEKLLKVIEPYVVKLTRKDTGHKHEAKDIVHNIPLNKTQNKMIKALQEDLLVIKGDIEILADTPVKLLTKSHQISGGISVNGEPLVLPNPDFVKVKKKVRKKMSDEELESYENGRYILKPTIYRFEKSPPKVKYIQANFDPETTIILSHYLEEQKYLAEIFPHTGSVTKMSTGVDLSHFKTMVLYSMAFSSATFEQVRARLMNVKRKKKVRVHILISGIDEYVHQAVKAKENFTSRWYKENG